MVIVLFQFFTSCFQKVIEFSKTKRRIFKHFKMWYADIISFLEPIDCIIFFIKISKFSLKCALCGQREARNFVSIPLRWLKDTLKVSWTASDSGFGFGITRWSRSIKITFKKWVFNESGWKLKTKAMSEKNWFLLFSPDVDIITGGILNNTKRSDLRIGSSKFDAFSVSSGLKNINFWTRSFLRVF